MGWNAITVEMKALPHHLGQGEFVQVFDYLKCRQDRLGLLVNMGLDRVAIDRVVYDPPTTEWIEDWNSWTRHIDGEDRDVGLAVRESLEAVYEEHTTGYGEEVLTNWTAPSRSGGILPPPIFKPFCGGWKPPLLPKAPKRRTSARRKRKLWEFDEANPHG